jgi:Leucine-rich repeat (LRR) protein
MKKLTYLFFCLSVAAFGQNTLIPDPNFEQALIDLGYDTAPINGSVPTANISSVTNLSVIDKNISDLTGIEDFTALTVLGCSNNQISNLDLSNIPL